MIPNRRFTALFTICCIVALCVVEAQIRRLAGFDIFETTKIGRAHV